MADDQLFCLRWNNFQTNFTSQFEVLRAEEDFVDVTLACEGKRIKAHKLVLSACSPYFKELLKGNPCKHPIVFMQDVEYEHLLSLVEFMYAGEVNIAQAQLPTFLHTAESLQIRGLTAAPKNKSSPDSTKTPSSKKSGCSTLPHDDVRTNSRNKSPDSNQGTSEEASVKDEVNAFSPKPSPSKKVCLPPEQPHHSRETVMFPDISTAMLEPKTEPMEYFSDGEAKSSVPASPFTGMENLGYTLQDKNLTVDVRMTGALDAASQMSSQMSQINEWSQESVQDQYYPRCKDGKPNLIAQFHDKGPSSRVSLGFGVEVRLDQLRGVKWSDYRKLTRGLASILFSHQELATRSVTGQRWSRYLSAGDSRPVKPALDPAKIHAIITYVRALFPHVAASHIKQVLAYKCKECAAAVAHKALPSSSA